MTIDENLLEDLKNRASEKQSECSDLIEEYIRKGLYSKGDEKMLMVGLNDNVVEKIKIKCKISNKTPEQIVNEVLWDNLEKIEDIPDHFDGDKLWNMLNHDKPEGDDILDRITDMFD